MKAFIARTDMGYDDPVTKQRVLIEKGTVVAHPDRIAAIEASDHLSSHGHFFEASDEHVIHDRDEHPKVSARSAAT